MAPLPRRATPGKSIDPAGRFRIEAEIARGGMGRICRAWDHRLERTVAVKLLLEEHLGHPALENRFFDEAKCTARLEHPGIVPVFEIGRTRARRPFFAMGLVEGTTLARRLATRSVPAPGEDLPVQLQIFRQVCQAVAHAHASGVAHRDLKPENVMVGDLGIVKVIDWGIARSLAREESPDEDWLLGTPAYLPPEQAAAAAGADAARSDVFSLGGILCEILTGLPPYPGGDPAAALARARAADLDDAWRRLDACPADPSLVRLARSCLAPLPSARPADAAALESVLRGILECDVRRAERDQARFFELSLELFCIAGTDGFFRRVNGNFPNVLGHPERELLSRPFLDFVHPEDQAATRDAMADLREGRDVVRFVNRYRHADGSYLRLEWSSRAIPDEGVIYAVARRV
jgi:serine/threonine-protein kinase